MLWSMGKTFFMNLLNVTKAYKNIRNLPFTVKILEIYFIIGHGDEYTTGCLLNYIYSKKTIRRLQYI